VSCDVSRPDDLRTAVAAADELGGVTVMVNNGGIFRIGDFLGVTDAEYDTLMDINVKGTFFGAQGRGPFDGQGGPPSVYRQPVVGGRLQGDAVTSTCSTSKGAVRLLTKSLADALGPQGIRVKAIHPGLIET
jgi:NAD(P)-dependent dehydrogenase (short-subunit alcohol dehydrogenase family)